MKNPRKGAGEESQAHEKKESKAKERAEESKRPKKFGGKSKF